MAPTEQSDWREIAGVAVLAAVVTGLITWPLLGVLSTHLPVSAGDSGLNAWVLAWGADRFAHGLQGVWSPPVFYPYANTLAYSENLLGVAALVAPVQWVSGNPTLTYNVAFLLSFVVAAVGAYLLAQHLTGSRAAGVVAAFAFAFAPYRWAQLTHIQVLWTAWLPWALWALHRALRTFRWPSWAVFMLVTLLQVLSNGYSAFQVAIAIPLVAVWSVARYGVDRVLLLRGALVAVLLAAALTPAVVAHSTIWGARETATDDLVAYSADLSAYLNVHASLPDARWLPGVAQDEGHLFPGVAVSLLALLALVPFRRWPAVPSARWPYVAMAVVAVVLSLGPEPRAWHQPLPLPPVYDWLLAGVPFFNAMRVPARFGMLAVLAISVLAGLGFSRVLAAAGRARRLGWAAGLALLIVFEGYGGPVAVIPNVSAGAGATDAVYDWLALQPPGAVLHLPMGTLGKGHAMDQQYVAIQSGRPMVDGVSRIASPLVEWLSGSGSPLLDPELARDSIPFLRGLGVRFILLTPARFFDPDLAARVSGILAQGEGVVERGQFQETIAWEITPSGPPPAPEPALTRIAPRTLALSASDLGDRVALAVDGNPNTRWYTSEPQSGNEWVAVDFDRPVDVATLVFTIHARSLIDYPRVLEVASQTSAGVPETLLYRGTILEPLGRGWRQSPERPVVELSLPANQTTRLVLRQRGHAFPWRWAIDELALWERARSR